MTDLEEREQYDREQYDIDEEGLEAMIALGRKYFNEPDGVPIEDFEKIYDSGALAAGMLGIAIREIVVLRKRLVIARRACDLLGAAIDFNVNDTEVEETLNSTDHHDEMIHLKDTDR